MKLKKMIVPHVLNVSDPLNGTPSYEKEFNSFADSLNWAFRHTEGTAHLKVYMKVEDGDLKGRLQVADICLFGIDESMVEEYKKSLLDEENE